jgi:hypothetical protein
MTSFSAGDADPASFRVVLEEGINAMCMGVYCVLGRLLADFIAAAIKLTEPTKEVR